MREVYANADISPRDTGFVEAHGTGTKVYIFVKLIGTRICTYQTAGRRSH